MGLKNSVQPLQLVGFNTAGLSGTYTVVNINGIESACFMLKFINTSNVDVTISYDGTIDHDLIPADSTSVINAQQNHNPYNGNAYFSKGTKIYVKGAAGTGQFYVTGYFQHPGN